MGEMLYVCHEQELLGKLGVIGSGDEFKQFVLKKRVGKIRAQQGL